MHKLIILTILISLCNGCHYSCLSCTGSQYISCLNCSSGTALTIVQNTTITPNQYWSSVYSTGTCVSTMALSANALGVVIFILVVGVTIFFRTKQCFYLLLTLQTYGLYNLVEMAWVNPIGYVLQGLQYFMIFNTMGSGYKTEDYLLVASKNYRLDSFLGTTNLSQNLAIIAPFTLVPLVMLIVLAVVAAKRRKQPVDEKGEAILSEKADNFITTKELQGQHGVEEPEQGRCSACHRWLSEQILDKIARFLLCLLFLMVQQTCVVLLVALVYQSPTSTSAMALCIIYLHILLFMMGYCYYYRIEYFKEKRLMYLTFAQKIILPVMVVVPIKDQFIFFIFAGCFLIFQFIFDWLNGLYKQFNRILIYKACQVLCIIVLTVYYIVQNTLYSYSSSHAAAIAATFVLAVNLFCFFGVQLPFAIKDKYFSGAEPAIEDVEMKDMVQVVQNDTVNDINEVSEPVENKNKQELMVEDFQDSQDSKDGDLNLNEGKKDDATLDGNNSVAEPQRQVVVPEVVRKSKKREEEEPQVAPVQPPKPPKKRRKQIIDPALRLRYGI